MLTHGGSAAVTRGDAVGAITDGGRSFTLVRMLTHGGSVAAVTHGDAVGAVTDGGRRFTLVRMFTHGGSVAAVTHGDAVGAVTDGGAKGDEPRPLGSGTGSGGTDGNQT